jgi:hypothetical protein
MSPLFLVASIQQPGVFRFGRAQLGLGQMNGRHILALDGAQKEIALGGPFAFFHGDLGNASHQGGTQFDLTGCPLNAAGCEYA